jgi:hypothetical protein
MFFKVHVLYIQESESVYNSEKVVEAERTALVIDLCKKYGFPYTVVPLETVYQMKPVQLEKGIPSDLEGDKYRNFHPDLPVNQILPNPETSKVRELLSSVEPQFQGDLVFALKKHLMMDFCLRYNFKRILLSTSGHSIACKMIGQIAKGRGATIANEVSYCGEQLFGQRVTVCRPMRDFLQKEIAVYIYSNRLEIISQKSLAEMGALKHRAPFFGSTDLIVEGFFNRL